MDYSIIRQLFTKIHGNASLTSEISIIAVVATRNLIHSLRNEYFDVCCKTFLINKLSSFKGITNFRPDMNILGMWY
jgi:hypothetical protein